MTATLVLVAPETTPELLVASFDGEHRCHFDDEPIPPGTRRLVRARAGTVDHVCEPCALSKFGHRVAVVDRS